MVSYLDEYNFIMMDRNDGQNCKNKRQTNQLELSLKSPVSDSLRELTYHGRAPLLT